MNDLKSSSGFLIMLYKKVIKGQENEQPKIIKLFVLIMQEIYSSFNNHRVEKCEFKFHRGL